MSDDVSTGAFKYLSTFSDLTSLLGSFSPSDPVSANRSVPWLFADDILVTMKGSSQIAVVLNDFGGTAPPMYGTQRLRRLRADIWVDPARDANGNITVTTADTKARGQNVFRVLHTHLHRRDADTVVWGDMVTYGCTLLTEPVFTQVPDGDWLLMGSAVYLVYLSGYTDALS